jgi:hypothetical protein
MSIPLVFAQLPKPAHAFFPLFPNLAHVQQKSGSFRRILSPCSRFRAAFMSTLAERPLLSHELSRLAYIGSRATA